MGGFGLPRHLADAPAWGGFVGVMVAAVFGCTLTFTLPVGIGVIEENDTGYFLKGIIIGLITMPAGFFLGGLLFGFSPLQLLAGSPSCWYAPCFWFWALENVRHGC